MSFIVLLMPVLFYFINWLLSQERSNALIFREYFLNFYMIESLLCLHAQKLKRIYKLKQLTP